mgnify:CR=1 FL=1|jgi:uncharacterized protein YcfJ
MKSLLLLPLILLTSVPVQATESQAGWSRQCFKNVYREEYVPGNATSVGYVRSWNETKEVPCRRPPMTALPAPEKEDNSCLEGSILGGISGGAAGGVLSTQKNWIWSIPLGIVGGSMIGCQIDGG